MDIIELERWKPSETNPLTLVVDSSRVAVGRGPVNARRGRRCGPIIRISWSRITSTSWAVIAKVHRRTNQHHAILNRSSLTRPLAKIK